MKHAGDNCCELSEICRGYACHRFLISRGQELWRHVIRVCPSDILT